MELLCPECMGSLKSDDGREATCTVHGGRFNVLFLRPSPFAPPLIPSGFSYGLTEGAACAQHPATPAAYACPVCGTPICGLCSFDQPDGSHLCPGCAQRGVMAAPLAFNAAPPVAQGIHCVQHPRLQATAQCKSCGGFMCDTCKFELPGGINLCPACAANPQTNLTARQKTALIGSYVAAVWCTIVMAALFNGVFQSKDKNMQQVVGLLLMLILIAPAVTGLCLAVGIMRRQQANPISVWIATVWNSIILGGFFLLMIIGLLRGV